MKIINSNKKNNILYCNCGCEFEYTNDDIDKEYSFYLGNLLQEQRFVKCPECGLKHYILDNYIATILTTFKGDEL